jgi:hypothetical protein
LRQLQRLDHDALLLFVVSELGVTGQREILSQWVPIKAIIRHDTTQVWVSNEEDSKEIVNLSLVPVGAIIQAGNARDRRSLIGICLDPDAGVVAYAQKVIDHFESLVPGREVHGRDVRYLCEFGGGVICRVSARVWNTAPERDPYI